MATRPTLLARPIADDDHVRGDLRSARLVLVEYGDFQCPYCGQARQLLDALRKRHDAELALVWRHLPLPEMHPQALPAAHAAEAAGRQGRFWEMHDRLFDDQRALDPDGLRAAASALDLDVERFVADATDPDIAARVQRDRDDAEAVPLRSTPSFYLDDQLLLAPWPSLRGLVPQLLSTRRRGGSGADPAVTSASHGTA